MSISEKRKKAEEKLYELLDTIDPSKYNSSWTRKKLSKLTDTQFDAYMTALKEGKTKIRLYTPSFSVVITKENLLAAAKKVGLDLFERLKLWDPVSKRYYTTRHKYMVLRLPIRRLAQTLEHKISIPKSDTKVDLLTGQVVKPDKGASISPVEYAVLHSRGQHHLAREFINARGGNQPLYAALRGSIEETGEADLKEIDTDTHPRSVATIEAFMRGMVIDSNFRGGPSPT